MEAGWPGGGGGGLSILKQSGTLNNYLDILASRYQFKTEMYFLFSRPSVPFSSLMSYIASFLFLQKYACFLLTMEGSEL